MNPDSPAFLESELLRLCRELEGATQDMAGYARASAEADANYKRARAQAVLRTHAESSDRKLTVTIIEAMADEATQAQYFRKRVAEADLSACQEKARNIRAQLEALRSVNANQRWLLEKA